jgi:hypothetical protein
MASVIIHDITVDHHGGSHSHTHLGSSTVKSARIRGSAAGTHRHQDRRQREHPREEHRTGVNQM